MSTLQDRYQQLVQMSPDDLEEGTALTWAGAPPDRKAVAQQWLQLGISLRDQEQAATGVLRAVVHARRMDALAVAYLIYQGAPLQQLSQIRTSSPAAPAATQGFAENLGRAITRAARLVPGDAGAKLLELATPESLATMAAVFGAWALGQAFGIGAVADVLLVAYGSYTLGLDALRAGRSFYGFVTQCTPPARDDQIQSAAQDLADFIALVGVDLLTVILMGKAFRWAREKIAAGRPGGAPRRGETRTGPEGGEGPEGVGSDGVPESLRRPAGGGDGVPESLRSPADSPAETSPAETTEQGRTGAEEKAAERTNQRTAERTSERAAERTGERTTAADLARGAGTVAAPPKTGWTKVLLITGGAGAVALLLWEMLRRRGAAVAEPAGPGAVR